jgi:hypothetical protein
MSRELAGKVREQDGMRKGLGTSARYEHELVEDAVTHAVLHELYVAVEHRTWSLMDSSSSGVSFGSFGMSLGAV